MYIKRTVSNRSNQEKNKESKTESEALGKLKGLRGLVVDDDLVACASISKMLKDISMRSEWCTSGKEAVFRAETAFDEGDNFSVYMNISRNRSISPNL